MWRGRREVGLLGSDCLFVGTEFDEWVWMVVGLRPSDGRLMDGNERDGMVGIKPRVGR